MYEHSSMSAQLKATPVRVIAHKILDADKPLTRQTYKEASQGLAIQPKLSIGAIDSPLEKEADA